MEPPIKIAKKPKKFEFDQEDFEEAYIFAKEYVKKNFKEGTKILMLAQLTR
jgi:hypothetical protein